MGDPRDLVAALGAEEDGAPAAAARGLFDAVRRHVQALLGSPSERLPRDFEVALQGVTEHLAHAETLEHDATQFLVASLALAVKVKAACHHVFRHDGVPAVVRALRTFPEEKTVAMDGAVMLATVCAVERKGSAAIRLAGGVAAVLELLGAHRGRSGKITRLAMDLLSAVLFRSQVNKAKVTNLGGVRVVMEIALGVEASQARLLGSCCLALERLCAHGPAASVATECGAVGWALSLAERVAAASLSEPGSASSEAARLKIVNHCVRILKGAVRTPSGFAEMRHDGVVPRVCDLVARQYAGSDVATKLCSQLVWLEQRQTYCALRQQVEERGVSARRLRELRAVLGRLRDAYNFVDVCQVVPLVGPTNGRAPQVQSLMPGGGAGAPAGAAAALYMSTSGVMEEAGGFADEAARDHYRLDTSGRQAGAGAGNDDDALASHYGGLDLSSMPDSEEGGEGAAAAAAVSSSSSGAGRRPASAGSSSAGSGGTSLPWAATGEDEDGDFGDYDDDDEYADEFEGTRGGGGGGGRRAGGTARPHFVMLPASHLGRGAGVMTTGLDLSAEQLDADDDEASEGSSSTGGGGGTGGTGGRTSDNDLIAQMEGLSAGDEAAVRAAKTQRVTPGRPNSGGMGDSDDSEMEEDELAELVGRHAEAAAAPSDERFSLADFCPELWVRGDPKARRRLAAGAEVLAASQTRHVFEWVAELPRPSTDRPLLDDEIDGAPQRGKAGAAPAAAGGGNGRPPAAADVDVRGAPLYRAPPGLALDRMRLTSERLEAGLEGLEGAVVYDRTVLDLRNAHPDTHSPPLSAEQLDELAVLRALGEEKRQRELARPVDTRDDWPSPALEFESRFETGNLHRAVRVGDTSYDLVLTPDVNSHGHTQWFCFRVRNAVPGPEYTFSIVNLEKPSSTFSDGMRPVMFSARRADRDGVGWHRAAAATKIAYHHNIHERPFQDDKKKGGGAGKKDDGSGASGDLPCFYTLTWSMRFEHADDTVYLSHFYPYSYTYLREVLDSLEARPGADQVMQRQPLTWTRGGNVVELLTITDFSAAVTAIRRRPVVVLSARVHPGETNASWMMDGTLRWLVSAAPDAARLRSRLVVKVVPMLNPDGVIAGNYRCSLGGTDLNRNYGKACPTRHPTIFAIKRLVFRLARQRQLLLVADMHGHSRMLGAVMYGCDKTNAQVQQLPADRCNVVVPYFQTLPFLPSSWRGRERVFSAMFAARAPRHFDFDGCRFSATQYKAGTARVVYWKELRLWNSFTIEASFCGAPGSDVHWSVLDFGRLGTAFAQAVADLTQEDFAPIRAGIQMVQAAIGGSVSGSGGGSSSSGRSSSKGARARSASKGKGSSARSSSQSAASKRLADKKKKRAPSSSAKKRAPSRGRKSDDGAFAKWSEKKKQLGKRK